MKDLALLVLRLTIGGLLAGHGAQKLFGWFGGYGLKGTGGYLESLGLRPGARWAPLAGMAEFSGGTLTALGLGSPLGPIGVIAAMGTAAGTAHRGKPIWAAAGGAELPVTNMAVAGALALAGPGRYSLDRMLGIRVPVLLAVLAAAAAAGGVALAVSQSAQASKQEEQPASTVQAGESEAEAEEAFESMIEARESMASLQP
jgi:putative oxidoreductase